MMGSQGSCFSEKAEGWQRGTATVTSQLLSQRCPRRAHGAPSSTHGPLLSPSLSYDHISFILERCITGSPSLPCLEPWCLPRRKDSSFLPWSPSASAFLSISLFAGRDGSRPHAIPSFACWSWRTSRFGDCRRQRSGGTGAGRGPRCLTDPSATLSMLKPGFRKKLRDLSLKPSIKVVFSWLLTWWHL